MSCLNGGAPPFLTDTGATRTTITTIKLTFKLTLTPATTSSPFWQHHTRRTMRFPILLLPLLRAATAASVPVPRTNTNVEEKTEAPMMMNEGQQTAVVKPPTAGKRRTKPILTTRDTSKVWQVQGLTRCTSSLLNTPFPIQPNPPIFYFVQSPTTPKTPPNGPSPSSTQPPTSRHPAPSPPRSRTPSPASTACPALRAIAIT